MKKGLMVATILALVVLSAGCAGDSTPIEEAAEVSPATGAIEVRVTDAPPEYGDIKYIFVTVEEPTDPETDPIMVHRAADEQEPPGEGEWESIPIIGDNPFDLLELKEEGIDLLLGWAQVPSGKYTQIKMAIEEVKVIFEGDDPETEEDDIEKVARLPSGQLKFVRPFDVVDGETTILLLDFIADESLTVTGKGDVVFKPVVKLTVYGKEKPKKDELFELETTKVSGEATVIAELSDDQAHSGKDSVHLQTTGIEGTGDEARIVILLPDNTKLGQIESISWYEYLSAGYPPHVDVILSTDTLVFEYAYNSMSHYNTEAPMPYGAIQGDWYQTFADDGNGPAKVDDTSIAWLGSGSPGPPAWVQGTLADWKAGTVDGSVGADTIVLRIEIEIDNWVVESEAYVDDIEVVIDGVTYIIDF